MGSHTKTTKGRIKYDFCLIVSLEVVYSTVASSICQFEMILSYVWLVVKNNCKIVAERFAGVFLKLTKINVNTPKHAKLSIEMHKWKKVTNFMFNLVLRTRPKWFSKNHTNKILVYNLMAFL